MGKRRIRCLVANGVPQSAIRLVEPRKDRCQEVSEKYGVEGLADLETGLAWGPDAFVISVPGAFHMPLLLTAARAGKHAFCEVPLSTSQDGLEELIGLARERKLVIAPGVQSPLHPVWRKVKEWLSEASFGKPLIYHQLLGSYLPDWHPYEDYRRYYASDQTMGGCNVDLIAQELAAFYWLLPGRVQELFCRGRLLSSLEIHGYDFQQILAWTDTGMALTLQFDVFQRSPINIVRIISEQGTVEYTPQYAKRFLAGFDDWEVFQPPSDYQYEQCYVDEIKLFIEAINGRQSWHNPLSTATEVVRFLTALSDSQSTNAIVKV